MLLLSARPKPISTHFPPRFPRQKHWIFVFEVSGRLIQENLLTGSRVTKGAILARIDPAPFEQRLRESTARLEQAKRAFARIEPMFKKELVSQEVFDNARTAQELAEIDQEMAKQDLDYTTITAPFDATVSERFTENDSYVQAGEVVARIQDVSRFYFNFNVPERLFSSHRPGTHVMAEAYIVSAPDNRFQLEYVEHATQPDPITQTYRVVFAGGAHATLTSGARAVVDVTLGYQSNKDSILVPFTSLQGNNTKGFHIWKFDSSTSQVTKSNVSVLRVIGDQALISGDIQEQDLIVAAGGSKMREGLKVRQYFGERQ